MLRKDSLAPSRKSSSLVFYYGKFQECIRVKLWLEYPVSFQTAHILKVRPPADGTVLGVARTLGSEALLQEVISWERPLGHLGLSLIPALRELGLPSCGIPSHCRPRIEAVKD